VIIHHENKGVKYESLGFSGIYIYTYTQLDGFNHLRPWRPAGLLNNRSIKKEEHRSAHQTKPNQKQKFGSIIMCTEI